MSIHKLLLYPADLKRNCKNQECWHLAGTMFPPPAFRWAPFVLMSATPRCSPGVYLPSHTGGERFLGIPALAQRKERTWVQGMTEVTTQFWLGSIKPCSLPGCAQVLQPGFSQKSCWDAQCFVERGKALCTQWFCSDSKSQRLHAWAYEIFGAEQCSPS